MIWERNKDESASQKGRKGMYLKGSCLAVIVLFATAPFSAGQSLSATTLHEYPPYCFLKKNPRDKVIETIPPGADSDRLRGYSWEIFRESFHAMGYTITLAVYPWSRAMHVTRQGQADVIFPAGQNDERKKVFLYSKEPVNSAKFLVYVREDTDIEWRGLESLNGMVIAVMRGFNYGNLWAANEKIKKYEIDEIMAGFRMLDKKRIDGFAGYEDNWDYALKQAGWKTAYKKLPVFDSSDEYVMGLKSNPRISEVLEAFDSGKRRIIENGRHREIVGKWMGR